MKIDISTLSAKIAAFKQISQQDAISPSVLGNLLDEITELIGKCASADDVEGASKIYNAVRYPGTIVTDLGSVTNTPGIEGRNSLELRYQIADIASAEKSVKTVAIPASTLSHAGLMTASQYMDLNIAKSEISLLKDEVRGTRQDLEDVAKLQRSCFKDSHFSLLVDDEDFETSRIKVVGHANLIKKGYVPYVFRLMSKKNQIKDQDLIDKKGKLRTRTKKGWCLYGSCYSAEIRHGLLSFSSNLPSFQTTPANSYSTSPSTLVSLNDKLTDIRWGSNSIPLRNFVTGGIRTVHLHFALAFGPRFEPGKKLITPANMVTPLVPFDIVFSPSGDLLFKDEWDNFGNHWQNCESDSERKELLLKCFQFSKPTS